MPIQWLTWNDFVTFYALSLSLWHGMKTTFFSSLLRDALKAELQAGRLKAVNGFAKTVSAGTPPPGFPIEFRDSTFPVSVKSERATPGHVFSAFAAFEITRDRVLMTEEITLYTKEQCEERGLVFDTAHRWWNGNSVLADAKIVPGQAASWVSFETIDGHSGTGWVLPSDEGANILDIANAINVTGGNLAYSSWDELKSTSNMIQVFAGQGHLHISFIADDGLAGLFAGAVAGEAIFQGNGVFNWK
ncbi:hypothetical protein EW146_g6553 [Bondarzewia mesenterica]|uniref:Uncharacterized protein n=1 Tax=Bondarzewia mesenterica TaxID=1095465 RepID=A0A4S4LNU7_9AGAM|nr:hypothetical protein EW146_g6553 [Bondarzewia mesenterica]